MENGLQGEKAPVKPEKNPVMTQFSLWEAAVVLARRFVSCLAPPQHATREGSGAFTEMQYWWVVAVSLLLPLAGLWTESAWVFRSGMRPSQAVILQCDKVGFWAFFLVMVLFTMSPLILFRRWLTNSACRLSIVIVFYAFWTWVAFQLMPAVTR